MPNWFQRTFLGKSNNKYNNAFYKFFGGGEAKYDYDKKNYIEKGYNINPLVYAPVNARATKFSSIPFEVAKIEDTQGYKQYKNLVQASKHNLTPQQRLKAMELQDKSLTVNNDFILENPNPLMSWVEFKELFEIYLATCGEIYVYKLTPEGGSSAGEPIAFYILPSHYMEIIIKDNYNYSDLDSPIDHYKLIEGDQFTRFEADEIIHIKYSNPNYDIQGGNLYGQAPLRACYKNIVSSNEALDLNTKTLNNGGVFGFIHGKSESLLDPQAKAIKQRIDKMDSKALTERFSNIGVSSQELGFTKMSLNTDELKPFDFLNFDFKQICNALGWDDKLLGNDAGAKYDNYISAQKRVLIQTIVPDCELFKMMFDKHILPLYKKYQGYCMVYNINNLPEMQQDMEKLTAWVTQLIDKGVVNRRKGLSLMGIDIDEEDDTELLDEYTVESDILTLEQALNDDLLNE